MHVCESKGVCVYYVCQCVCVCVCVPCPSAVTPRPMIHLLITHQPYHTADPAMVTQPSERAPRPCRNAAFEDDATRRTSPAAALKEVNPMFFLKALSEKKVQTEGGGGDEGGGFEM